MMMLDDDKELVNEVYLNTKDVFQALSDKLSDQLFFFGDKSRPPGGAHTFSSWNDTTIKLINNLPVPRSHVSIEQPSDHLLKQIPLPLQSKFRKAMVSATEPATTETDTNALVLAVIGHRLMENAIQQCCLPFIKVDVAFDHDKCVKELMNNVRTLKQGADTIASFADRVDGIVTTLPLFDKSKATKNNKFQKVLHKKFRNGMNKTRALEINKPTPLWSSWLIEKKTNSFADILAHLILQTVPGKSANQQKGTSSSYEQAFVVDQKKTKHCQTQPPPPPQKPASTRQPSNKRTILSKSYDGKNQQCTTQSNFQQICSTFRDLMDRGLGRFWRYFGPEETGRNLKDPKFIPKIIKNNRKWCFYRCGTPLLENKALKVVGQSRPVFNK
ncbi:hypothetical protein BDR26DRAFT_917365 [Obelidium mucronatum]|nr:hypothetical protein BDR26DRAFT_917365 [Obelidium mucronatum]